jgi:hypothetical protein
MPEAPARKVAILLATGLAPGVAANVAACIAAGLAASRPEWAGRPLRDATGFATVSSSHLPITILRAEPALLRAALRRLAEAPDGADADAGVSLFPAYAQALHDCREYWERHGQSAHAEEEILGLGLQGPKRWVNRLAGSLPLWR